MKRFRVILTPDARLQVADQVLYIARHSIDNAIGWELRLQVEINQIGDLPGHAVDMRASKLLGFEVRRMTFERNYLVHYHLDETKGEVRVLNVRHVARNPREDQL